mmetsp:Transcript_61186/g.167887  ORF Transcript_61186/g.167887 Transcript_61186/m.167887 type:complete len:100 (-) Transcript_61186:62-361(-)
MNQQTAKRHTAFVTAPPSCVFTMPGAQLIFEVVHALDCSSIWMVDGPAIGVAATTFGWWKNALSIARCPRFHQRRPIDAASLHRDSSAFSSADLAANDS